MNARFRAGGFTLVEVALALGIAALALASLLGLLGAATSANQDSSRDTALVAMTSSVMASLRSVPFDALWAADPSTGSAATAGSGAPVDTLCYFTAEGALLTGPSAAASPAAVYLCTVHKTPDEATRSILPGGPYHLLQLQLIYSWPLAAPAPRRQTRLVHANLARY